MWRRMGVHQSEAANLIRSKRETGTQTLGVAPARSFSAAYAQATSGRNAPPVSL